ncbi:ankyrin repeat-containing protein, partial [Trifolium medium]|nr:ankyrin repeat-containing protein [Trifolium medium]
DKKPRHIFTESHKELVKAGEKWAKDTADAISLFTSSTAVLLFIGILTARYAENDFLKSLPLKLLFGLIALFFSVVSMMVAFCASLAMLLKGHEGIIITAMSFACIPVIVLLPSQLRLFIEIFKSMVLSN